MKNNLSLQTSARANTMINGHSSFTCMGPVNKTHGYGKKFLTVAESGSFSPIMKINGKETGLNPFFNFPIKQVAACLSEIEMALDCYNVSDLQFSTHALKELFFDMRMPAVNQLAGQMEKSAGENQFQEVKDLLREIKKIIGQVVKHRMQPGD
jgi:hypothetical protein